MAQEPPEEHPVLAFLALITGLAIISYAAGAAVALLGPAAGAHF